ncbi:MAG: NUDIX hydrolase [Mycobacteriales bacterium]
MPEPELVSGQIPETGGAPGARTVLAAGTVLWRRGPSGPEIAVVHRPKYDDWSLPKGKVDPGEHPALTAVRETAEESGFHGALGRFLGQVRYGVRADAGTVPKIVSYWAMEASAGAFVPNAEVDRLRWLAAEDCLAVLSRPDDRAPVFELLAVPAAATTVLLVRHGHAGRRSSWPGPDDLRPLNLLGRREAAAIAAVLPAYGPVAVSAAEPLRCRQTVAPLAGALGVVVDAAPDLSESAYARHPDRAVARIRALAAAGRPVAVCSQGGVIPGLLRSLRDRHTRGRRTRAARKGSVWVLSFADGRLAAADYLPDVFPAA